MPSVIEQIANDLNISTASVSRALNDRPGVGAELRARILAKAHELNYVPSLTARGLATAQTFAIGFFVREKPGLPMHADPFYSEILLGVEQVCATSAYHVTIATLTEDILARPTAFRFVREQRVDGMILAGPDIPNDFILAMLQTEMPVVLIDNCLDYSAVSCVNSDDEKGAYLAARHLLQGGHRAIGVIAGPQRWASTMRRVNGYRRALQTAGVPLHVVHVDRTTIESGEAAYHQLNAQQPDLTAICAINDAMAIGAIRAARSGGKAVPADLSVVGFDDIDWARLNDPPLTTVNIAKHQMGKEAANRLITMLNDPDLLPTEIKVAVQFMQRQSSRDLTPG
ncbi:MAG: LacI family DNA-binding transcriptional regulator [Anaerolineae bacterium]|nr:LacI family DNA-binding transcriptional regulator [Anaerolineae bacterium]